MTELHQQLRTTLLRCGPFASDSQLQAIFVDTRLQPWKDEVSSGLNPLERVEAIIALLSGRRNARGEQGIVLFLRVLADRTHPGDACHLRLRELADALEEAPLDAGDNAVPLGERPGMPSGPSQIIVHGDYYSGDRVENVSGDHIEGDISVERISGSAVSVGHQAQSHVRQSEAPRKSVALFSRVYRQIEALPGDPDVDHDEIVEVVKKIERELMGPDPNPRKVERWLRNLGEIATATQEALVAVLSEPQEAIAPAIRDVARRIQAGDDG